MMLLSCFHFLWLFSREICGLLCFCRSFNLKLLLELCSSSLSVLFFLLANFLFQVSHPFLVCLLFRLLCLLLLPTQSVPEVLLTPGNLKPGFIELFLGLKPLLLLFKLFLDPLLWTEAIHHPQIFEQLIVLTDLIGLLGCPKGDSSLRTLVRVHMRVEESVLESPFYSREPA